MTLLPLNLIKMSKENETLSEKIDGYDPITQIVVRNDVKEHTQNAQRRLKEEFEKQKKSCKEVWHRDVAFQYLTTLELLEEDINKIFLEEFGRKLI